VTALKLCPMCRREVEARGGALVEHHARMVHGKTAMCPGSRTPVPEAEAIRADHRSLRAKFPRVRPAHAMMRKAGVS
jgi:hypothetical protein